MLTCCGQLNDGFLAKLVQKSAYKYSILLLPKGVPYSQIKMTRAGALEMPIRNMAAMSDGDVSVRTAEGLLDIVNGKLFRGLWKMFTGFIKKQPSKRERFPD